MGTYTDIKNTIIKDPETFDPQRLLNPIDDMMQVLNTPIKLAKSHFLSKINNFVNIAAGQRIPVNDGHVLTVKTQGIEVSGGNNPYDTQAYVLLLQLRTVL